MDASILASLPRELRDMIYRHLLVQTNGINITKVRIAGQKNSFLQMQDAQPSNNITAILRTCNQLNAECASIFYERNTFSFDIDVFENLTIQAAEQKRPRNSVFGFTLRPAQKTSRRILEIDHPILLAKLLAAQTWLDACGPLPREHLRLLPRTANLQRDDGDVSASIAVHPGRRLHRGFCTMDVHINLRTFRTTGSNPYILDRESSIPGLGTHLSEFANYVVDLGIPYTITLRTQYIRAAAHKEKRCNRLVSGSDTDLPSTWGGRALPLLDISNLGLAGAAIRCATREERLRLKEARDNGRLDGYQYCTLLGELQKCQLQVTSLTRRRPI